jgi:hypothetical protein
VRGSGDLYTKEYLESCRARLAPGGVACLWVPLYQMGVSDVRDVLRTFCAVFPSVALFYGGEDLVAVGGQEVGDPRAPAGAALEQLERLSAADLGRLVVARRDRIVAAVGEGPILGDDALRLEYSTPRQVDDHEAADCLLWVRDLWGSPPPPYGSLLLALAAKKRGDGDAMWAHLDAAQKEAPGSAHVRRTMGELCLVGAGDAIREGRLEEGARYFRIARGYLAGDTRLTGLEADLRAAQAEAEAAAGNAEAAKELFAAARELFGRLLERDPASDYLRRKIAALP